MKKIVILVIACFLFSCSPTQKMRKIDHDLFCKKESKESKKDKRQNKQNKSWTQIPKKPKK